MKEVGGERQEEGGKRSEEGAKREGREEGAMERVWER